MGIGPVFTLSRQLNMGFQATVDTVLQSLLLRWNSKAFSLSELKLGLRMTLWRC